jgi:hypothetical protein
MDFHMLMKKAFLKYFILDYMKTIPQKCFPKKTDDRVRYNTYDSIGIKEKSL